jgi:CubicO group peptidase (beta-lactamase class C family)
MNDDELKKLWQQQPLRDPAPSPAQVVSAMQSKTTVLRRCLDARDFRELVACAVIVIIFGVFYFTAYRAPISRLGDLIVIGSSIFIAWKIVHARRTNPPAPPGATIVESLRAELNSVRTQSQLLGSILWWYLLPLGIGILVCTWGSPGGGLAYHIGYTIFVIALYAFIYWLNQRARARQLLPVEAQLESLIHSAQTGEPLNETHVANLRPIVLSMAAANRVKPVEFKVAFWQIALFGEIGFVGIWLAWTLSLAVDKIHRYPRGIAFTDFVAQIFGWQHLVWVVPFFLAGLLYSWLIQKTTERAVGISSLGVHLCKGQNLILWDEIKDFRPLRILHVRNLWLIRESGEKTLMHWTPLERHSDLNAAVQSFAPPNHAIRKCLSLLKPEPPKKNIMTKTILIGIVLISLAAIMFGRGREPREPKIATIEYSDSVSQMLETIRVKHDLPALAAAVVVDGKIVATNAVGFRKNGGPEKVTVDDKFHLGSVTKSMTATVAAMLVEQGKISWKTTIGETFPELKSEIHPDYLGVTLEQLLSQRSGAPGDAPADLWRKAWAAGGTAAAQRLAFIRGILARKPEAKPGTKFIYSNQGYTIAGVMLEKATGKTWEDLLRSMLFEPLGMTTAGFGAPASVDKIDQPWGHIRKAFSGNKPMSPGPGGDNPLAISPANAVHCSMGDLAKYAAFHMAGERGKSELLGAESFKKLHTALADNEDYALGWMVLERPWANGRTLMHNGSNTMFYVVVWMAPEKNCAVIVASNVGMDEAFKACDEAAVKLIKQFFPAENLEARISYHYSTRQLRFEWFPKRNRPHDFAFARPRR